MNRPTNHSVPRWVANATWGALRHLIFFGPLAML